MNSLEEENKKLKEEIEKLKEENKILKIIINHYESDNNDDYYYKPYYKHYDDDRNDYYILNILNTCDDNMDIDIKKILVTNLFSSEYIKENIECLEFLSYEFILNKICKINFYNEIKKNFHYNNIKEKIFYSDKIDWKDKNNFRIIYDLPNSLKYIAIINILYNRCVDIFFDHKNNDELYYDEDVDLYFINEVYAIKEIILDSENINFLKHL